MKLFSLSNGLINGNMAVPILISGVGHVVLLASFLAGWQDGPASSSADHAPRAIFVTFVSTEGEDSGSYQGRTLPVVVPNFTDSIPPLTPPASSITIPPRYTPKKRVEVQSPETNREVVATNSAPKGPADGESLSGDGDGSHLAQSAYQKLLLGWLTSHSNYPPEARRRKMEGLVEIKLLLKRSGELIQAEVLSNSGNETLSGGALSMVKRASPFPYVPDNISEDNSGDSFEFKIPIRFRLIKNVDDE